MGTKTTTRKAAPVAKPSTPKVTLRDYADAVAGLAPEMRASSTPTRARVDHESHARLVTGFAGGFKSLQVSCPFWNPKTSGVVKKGSYLIRTFQGVSPADIAAKHVAPALRAKKVIS